MVNLWLIYGLMAEDEDEDAHLQRVTWNQVKPRKPKVLEDDWGQEQPRPQVPQL